MDNFKLKLLRLILSDDGSTTTPATTGNDATSMVGKYVVIRSNMAGVICGTLVAFDPISRYATLSQSRKLFSWQAKDGIAVEDIAENGIVTDQCKVTSTATLQTVCGVDQILLASDAARLSIVAAKVHKP
jgi:hypothetical protein